MKPGLLDQPHHGTQPRPGLRMPGGGRGHLLKRTGDGAPVRSRAWLKGAARGRAENSAHHCPGRERGIEGGRAAVEVPGARREDDSPSAFVSGMTLRGVQIPGGRGRRQRDGPADRRPLGISSLLRSATARPVPGLQRLARDRAPKWSAEKWRSWTPAVTADAVAKSVRCSVPRAGRGPRVHATAPQ